MNEQNTIPVLEKAILALTYLGGIADGATQAEMVDELKLSKATCYRMVQTFCKHNWLYKRSDMRYDLSYGLLNVCEKLVDRFAAYKLMQKPLENLCRKTDLSTKLSIRKGENEFITLLRVDADTPVAVTGKVGAAFPIIEGSVGGVLLSEASSSELRTLIEKCAADIQEKNEPEVLYARINECKEKGYCFCGKVNRWKIETVSAPIKNGDGKIGAAVSLLGFIPDFADRQEFLVGELQNTVEQCERILKNFKGR